MHWVPNPRPLPSSAHCSLLAKTQSSPLVIPTAHQG
jgi:hypothetical protein